MYIFPLINSSAGSLPCGFHESAEGFAYEILIIFYTYVQLQYNELSKIIFTAKLGPSY